MRLASDPKIKKQVGSVGGLRRLGQPMGPGCPKNAEPRSRRFGCSDVPLKERHHLRIELFVKCSPVKPWRIAADIGCHFCQRG